LPRLDDATKCLINSPQGRFKKTLTLRRLHDIKFAFPVTLTVYL
jgi:hypothetical protein